MSEEHTELRGVLGVDTSTVDDTGLVGDLLGDLFLEPFTDVGVDFLRLVDGRDLAGTDSPDGLVYTSVQGPLNDMSHAQATTMFLHDVSDRRPCFASEGRYSLPVLLLDLAGDSLELPLNDLHGHVLLPLLERFTNTSDDAKSGLHGGPDLVGDKLVGVAEKSSSLRVAENDPVDVGILELLWGDFTGEGTLELGVGVLGGDLDRGLDRFLDLEEVDGRRGNDDLYTVSSSDHHQTEANSPVLPSSWAELRSSTIFLTEDKLPFILKLPLPISSNHMTRIRILTRRRIDVETFWFCLGFGVSEEKKEMEVDGRGVEKEIRYVGGGAYEVTTEPKLQYGPAFFHLLTSLPTKTEPAFILVALWQYRRLHACSMPIKADIYSVKDGGSVSAEESGWTARCGK